MALLRVVRLCRESQILTKERIKSTLRQALLSNNRETIWRAVCDYHAHIKQYPQHRQFILAESQKWYQDAMGLQESESSWYALEGLVWLGDYQADTLNILLDTALTHHRYHLAHSILDQSQFKFVRQGQKRLMGKLLESCYQCPEDAFVIRASAFIPKLKRFEIFQSMYMDRRWAVVAHLMPKAPQGIHFIQPLFLEALKDASRDADAFRVCQRLLQEEQLGFSQLTLQGLNVLQWAQSYGSAKLTALVSKCAPQLIETAQVGSQLMQIAIHSPDLFLTPMRSISQYEGLCKDVEEIFYLNGLELNLNEIVNDQGQTALHVAVIKGSRSLVARLIRLGADVNAVDSQGKTPFDYAAKHKQKVIMAWLYSHQARLPEAYRKQQSQLELIAQQRACELAAYNNEKATLSRILRHAEEHFEQRFNKQGDYLLHLAVRYDLMDVVDFFVTRKAHLTRKNKDNLTPFQLAYQLGKREIAQRLDPQAYQQACLADKEGALFRRIVAADKTSYKQLSLIGSNADKRLAFARRMLASIEEALLPKENHLKLLKFLLKCETINYTSNIFSRGKTEARRHIDAAIEQLEHPVQQYEPIASIPLQRSIRESQYQYTDEALQAYQPVVSQYEAIPMAELNLDEGPQDILDSQPGLVEPGSVSHHWQVYVTQKEHDLAGFCFNATAEESGLSDLAFDEMCTFYNQKIYPRLTEKEKKFVQLKQRMIVPARLEQELDAETRKRLHFTFDREALLEHAFQVGMLNIEEHRQKTAFEILLEELDDEHYQKLGFWGWYVKSIKADFLEAAFKLISSAPVDEQESLCDKMKQSKTAMYRRLGKDTDTTHTSQAFEAYKERLLMQRAMPIASAPMSYVGDEQDSYARVDQQLQVEQPGQVMVPISFAPQKQKEQSKRRSQQARPRERQRSQTQVRQPVVVPSLYQPVDLSRLPQVPSDKPKLKRKQQEQEQPRELVYS